MRSLGRIAGLNLTFHNSAIPGTFLMWVLFAGAGHYLFHAGFVAALVGGLIAALLHVCSEVFHQLGHAAAARAPGYPMTGIRLWWMLGSSVYPADEPPLAAGMHIRRALGGPSASALLTLVALALWLLLRAVTPEWSWVGLVFFVDSLVFFTLGSFLPLGFTDGSTLLRWLPRR